MKRAGLSDTSDEAQRILDDVSRKMTPARKWAMLGDLYRTGRELPAAGVRLRDPNATSAEIQADRLDQSYLDKWAIELGVADLLADARREAGI